MNTLMAQFYKMALTQKLNEKLQELFLSDNIISVGWFTDGATTPSIITKDMILSNITSSNLITLYNESYNELYDNIDETGSEFIYVNDDYNVLFSQTTINCIH